MGDPRFVLPVADTGRPIDCDLGRGQDLAVDVASGKGPPIPFQARVEQTLNAPVRMPVVHHPPSFRSRMLRDVRVAPDGKLVVYSALGHLYTRPLPAGEPKRLTSAGADTYEFFPSFSRDGQWIVYTTWSDANRARPRHQA